MLMLIVFSFLIAAIMTYSTVQMLKKIPSSDFIPGPGHIPNKVKHPPFSTIFGLIFFSLFFLMAYGLGIVITK